MLVFLPCLVIGALFLNCGSYRNCFLPEAGTRSRGEPKFGGVTAVSAGAGGGGGEVSGT